MASFSPDRGEIFGIRTGLRGWRDVQGYGPDYFLPPDASRDLSAFVCNKLSDVTALKAALSASRGRVVNFFDLLAGEGDYNPQPLSAFSAETDLFLAQLREQVNIWQHGVFHALDMSGKEVDILAQVSVKASPVLYLMGFADAIPHSSQVARLCASMAHRENGRHSEILQAALVGKLHDPKFHPKQDIAKLNLATHPIIAVALANAIFDDPEIRQLILGYFSNNFRLATDFMEGVQDALAVNDDSWFVQIIFVLPQFVKRIAAKYGPKVAEGLKVVMEARLEAASRCKAPPELPPHLYGCLAQELLDSGLRGISYHGWQQALDDAGIKTDDAAGLYARIMAGSLGTVTQEQVGKLRASLRSNSTAILTAQIPATRLLHHHQEVIESGRVAAKALVIADPLMLSPHKVLAVYDNAIKDRLKSYITSFGDNIRLLPCNATEVGAPWERAIYLSMLLAADRLTGQKRLTEFAASHSETPMAQDVQDLRILLLDEKTWGDFANASGHASKNADVAKVITLLDTAYNQVVGQYRDAIREQGLAAMGRFLPKV